MGPRSQQELVLVLPRRQPPDAVALAQWLDRVRRAAHVKHPQLAAVVEVGEQERWPYVAYAGALVPTLTERERPRDGESSLDIARWVMQAATGLAFAHDAGHAHRDLQPWLLVLSDSGGLRVMGLEVADASSLPTPRQLQDDTLGATPRHALRHAAERDVLALAVVMHGLLAGAPALDEPDIGATLARLAPTGREPIRLAWDLPRPVPDVMRTIANRATTNTDRRVQLGRQALEPPGQARQDLWILQETARRIGLDWGYDDASDVWSEIRRAVPSCAGITWDRLEVESAVTYPCRNEGDPGEEVIFAERFPTPDGRGRMVPEFDAAVFGTRATGVLPQLATTRYGFH